jgi:type II secretion system protein N
MESVMKAITPVLYVIRNHKKTMLLSLISALIFAFLIFPFEDLSDYAIEKITKMSQGQVFLQFDDLGIALFPPSMEMANVEVEIGQFPALTASQLNLAPSIASYLAFSHGFVAQAEDLLDGNLSLTLKAGKKTANGDRKQVVDLEYEKVNIQKILRLLQVNSEIKGVASLDLTTTVDPTFGEQPTANLELTANDFVIKSVATPIGPLILNIQSSKIETKANLAESEFEVTELVIGKPGEGFFGKIKGRMGLRFEDRGRIVPVISNYEYTVDLNIDKKNDANLGLIFSTIGADKYKTVTGAGFRYAFKLSGANTFEPPRISPATSSL